MIMGAGKIAKSPFWLIVVHTKYKKVFIYKSRNKNVQIFKVKNIYR